QRDVRSRLITQPHGWCSNFGAPISAVPTFATCASKRTFDCLKREAVNARFGRGTMVPAGVGIKKREWQTKIDRGSRRDAIRRDGYPMPSRFKRRSCRFIFMADFASMLGPG